MNAPRTNAGQWLLDRSRWDDGMRGFFVRINATGAPDDMHRHILAIEQEAVEEWARIAVLGVDTDCGTCAGYGLDRLAEAVPGVDWDRLLHEVMHNVEKDPGYFPHYWCDYCEEE